MPSTTIKKNKKTLDWQSNFFWYGADFSFQVKRHVQQSDEIKSLFLDLQEACSTWEILGILHFLFCCLRADNLQSLQRGEGHTGCCSWNSSSNCCLSSQTLGLLKTPLITRDIILTLRRKTKPHWKLQYTSVKILTILWDCCSVREKKVNARTIWWVQYPTTRLIDTNAKCRV